MHPLTPMSNANVSRASTAAARTDEPCPAPVTCPTCRKDTPAVSNRSDGVVSYRCDACGHNWSAAARESDSELPPIPAIDAPGG